MIFRNILNYENKVVDFLEKHIPLILFVCITGLAIAARIVLFSYETEDYYGFYKIWYEAIVDYGQIHSLGILFTEYCPGYILIITLLTYTSDNPLFVIKIFPITCDFLIALVGSHMVMTILAAKKMPKEKQQLFGLLTYFSVLFAPTVLLNSALWGQCDTVWCFFLVCSFYGIMKHHYKRAFMFLGLCFSIKATGLIFLPVFVLFYLRRKDCSFLHILITPVTFLFVSLPCIISGAGIKNVIARLIFFDNTTTSALNSNFNGLYSFVATDNAVLSDTMKSLGLIGAFTLLGVLIACFFWKKADVEFENVLMLALLFACVTVYFMPSMHDRYLFIGDLISILFFFACGNRKYWYLPVVLQLFSGLSYCNYINMYSIDFTVPGQFFALLFPIFILFFGYQTYQKTVRERKFV